VLILATLSETTLSAAWFACNADIALLRILLIDTGVPAPKLLCRRQSRKLRAMRKPRFSWEFRRANKRQARQSLPGAALHARAFA
jgi:hypothetical protein